MAARMFFSAALQQVCGDYHAAMGQVSHCAETVNHMLARESHARGL
jgi:hypothetical protein